MHKDARWLYAHIAVLLVGHGRSSKRTRTHALQTLQLLATLAGQARCLGIHRCADAQGRRC